MHLFHKWETISKRKTHIIRIYRCGRFKSEETDIPAVVEIQKCKKCPKERAFVIDNKNVRVVVNPDLWR